MKVRSIRFDLALESHECSLELRPILVKSVCLRGDESAWQSAQKLNFFLIWMFWVRL